MKETSESDTKESKLMRMIDESFQRAIRGDILSLEKHLISTDPHRLGSPQTIHCHIVNLDGNQRPNVPDLARFLVDIVIDYSIPRHEIVEAEAYLKRTGSTQRISALKRKAKGLFADISANSGEGGEVLLFALTERYLKIPQIVCKMPLKTNSKVHYHGIDGIHAKVDVANGKLALYWGESKLYATVGKAITACFQSVEKFLTGPGGTGSVSTRDMEIVRSNLSLNDPNTKAAVLALLDEDNPLSNSIEYRAVCLIGFNFKSYPKRPMQKTIEDLREEVDKARADWNLKVEANVSKIKNLKSFEIEVLLIPFPNVTEFRKAFVEELKES